MALKLVVFDVEGTLVDSKTTMINTIAHASQFVGLTPPKPDQILRSIGLPFEVMFSSLFPNLNNMEEGKLNQMHKIIIESLSKADKDPSPLYKDVITLLENLRKNNIKIALATNKLRAGLDLMLDRLKLNTLIDGSYTADELRSKPSPDMIMTAMKDLNTGMLETVMIGDTMNDMVAADRAGVEGIGVTWGYQSADDLRHAGAKRLVSSVDELQKVLLSWQAA